MTRLLRTRSSHPRIHRLIVPASPVAPALGMQLSVQFKILFTLGPYIKLQNQCFYINFIMTILKLRVLYRQMNFYNLYRNPVV